MRTDPATADAAIDAILSRFVKYHPDRIDLSLDRMRRLLSDLDNPQDGLPPVIHIAGTNGKGSTAAFLTSALTQAGKRVSAYTSPHLVRFAERYRIAGDLLSDESLLALFEEVERSNAGNPITEFEITTAAAFLAMARAPADLVVLETGLGGRFDATNVVAHPAATVITPVGFDHMAFLGDTLAAITGEKAAIQKSGTPSIVATQQPDAEAVISDYAAGVGAPLYRCGIEWSATPALDGGGRYERAGTVWNLPPPGLPGRHQFDNAALAAACLEICDLAGVTSEAVGTGIANTSWPGRLQRLTAGSLVDRLPPDGELWLDAAHNPLGAEALARAFQEMNTADPKSLHLIFTLLDDKDTEGFLAPFAGVATSASAIGLPDTPRSRQAEALARAARAAGLAARPMAAVADALAQVGTEPGPVRVLVTGSHLLVGAMLRENG